MNDFFILIVVVVPLQGGQKAVEAKGYGRYNNEDHEASAKTSPGGRVSAKTHFLCVCT